MVDWLDDEALLGALTDGPTGPSGLSHLTGEQAGARRRERGGGRAGLRGQRKGGGRGRARARASVAAPPKPQPHLSVAALQSDAVAGGVLGGAWDFGGCGRRESKASTGAVAAAATKKKEGDAPRCVCPPVAGGGRAQTMLRRATAPLSPWSAPGRLRPPPTRRPPTTKAGTWRARPPLCPLATKNTPDPPRSPGPPPPITPLSPADEERLFHALGDGFNDLGGVVGGEGDDDGEDDGIDEKQVSRERGGRMQFPRGGCPLGRGKGGGGRGREGKCGPHRRPWPLPTPAARAGGWLVGQGTRWRG